MVHPVYRLPDHLPIVWTSATSIQVGVDPPLADLDNIPDNAEPLLHALTRGTPRSGLIALAKVHQLDEQWVSHLIGSLSPALTPSPPPDPPSWEVWSGSGGVTGFAQAAHRFGVELTIPDRIDHTTVPNRRFVVLLADYLVHPHWADWLLRRSVTHCPVVFSDQTVTVGPIVTPGTTPCLVCVESHRRDASPQWLEVSSQLWGKRSPLHTPRLTGMAWALLTLMLTPGAIVNATAGHTQAVFRADSEKVVWQTVTFHPECTCRGLDGR